MASNYDAQIVPPEKNAFRPASQTDKKVAGKAPAGRTAEFQSGYSSFRGETYTTPMRSPIKASFS